MNARKVLDMAGAAIDALPLIAGMTKVPVDKAQAALAGVHAAITALIDGVDGKLTAEEVTDRIEGLRSRLLTNDAKADAALAEKFQGGTR